MTTREAAVRALRSIERMQAILDSGKWPSGLAVTGGERLLIEGNIGRERRIAALRQTGIDPEYPDDPATQPSPDGRAASSEGGLLREDVLARVMLADAPGWFKEWPQDANVGVPYGINVRWWVRKIMNDYHAALAASPSGDRSSRPVPPIGKRSQWQALIPPQSEPSEPGSLDADRSRKGAAGRSTVHLAAPRRPGLPLRGGHGR